MDKRKITNIVLILTAVLVVVFFASAVRFTDVRDGAGAGRCCCCPVPAKDAHTTAKE